MQATWAITTQLGTRDVRYPLRRHYKSRIAGANVPRLQETFSTDTMFASTPGIGGELCCQLFVGNKSSLTAVYGMKRESEGIEALHQFVTDWGAPNVIRRDNSKMQNSKAWKAFERKMQIKSETSEPENQQQNPAERRIQTIKANVNQIMDKTNCPDEMWFECMTYIASILNMIAMERLGGRNAIEVALGHSVDISAYIQYEWWEPLYFLNYEDPSFPNSREKFGRFCGVAENCGDLLTFKIYVPDTHTIINRSVVRSAKDDKGNPNPRARNPHYSGTPIEQSSNHSISSESINSIDACDSPVVISSDEIEKDDKLLDNVTRDDSIPDPDDLVGFTFPHDRKGITQKAIVTGKCEDSDAYLIDLMDGSRATIEYNLLLEKFNASNEDGDQIFTFSSISGHRKIKGGNKYEVRVDWDGVGYEPTWEPLAHMKHADPITLAQYAKDNKLIEEPGWKWAKRIRTMDSSRLIRLSRRICKATRNDVRFKFGVRVPRNVKEAYDLDKQNNNSLWAEAISKEMKQLRDFGTFNILDRGERAPDGYQRIPLIICFDVKHDGRRKCRQVAGGHVTAPPVEDVYSTVVAPEGVRCIIFIAEHNGMQVWGGDVGNAYLNGTTREKVYAILGQEHGPELEGRVAIVVKSFYGLKTSCARWCEHLADTLRAMKWFKSTAVNDVWLRDTGSGFEYLAVYSDDIIVASNSPEAVYDEIKRTYTMKGVGVPEYYLGAECGRAEGPYTDKGSTTTLSAKTYIQNLIPRIEQEIYGGDSTPLKHYTTPMDPVYRPETDETPLLNTKGISQFRMLTGSAQWAITLGRMDIGYATTMLSRFNMCPREGHLQAMLRIFGYLKGKSHGKILFDARELPLDDVEFIEGSNWKLTYGDVQEDIPPNLPKQIMKPVTLSIYFDASFACDLITRRSVTGIIVFVNSTPIRWYVKKQNTVETSTYGAELVAGRIATEMAIEFRYIFRMLGVPVKGPVNLCGDNKGMVQNCSMLSSQLKKKHNAIAYHRIRESVAAGIIKLGHVSSEKNLSDICTKALPGPALHRLTKELLFRK